jgi:hypothetical protein
MLLQQRHRPAQLQPQLLQMQVLGLATQLAKLVGRALSL